MIEQRLCLEMAPVFAAMKEQNSAFFLECDNCNEMTHIDCLERPLAEVPKGVRECPKCRKEYEDILDDESQF